MRKGGVFCALSVSDGMVFVRTAAHLAVVLFTAESCLYYF